MSTAAGTKRKVREGTDEDMERDPKRTRATVTENPAPDGAPVEEPAPETRTTDVGPSESEKKKGKRRATQRDNDAESAPSTSSGVTYRKLAPPRPFPTVPTSVSATGPRSAHVEGKNYICVTRKTPLGAYLRRCKDVILKDGHKTLHLSALGAAIPHLVQLAVSLPSVLPHAPEEIHTEYTTGTVEVQDEVLPPDDDDEADVSYRTRGKSSLSVVVRVGDGVDEGPRTGKGMRGAGRGSGGKSGGRGGAVERAAGGNFGRDKGEGKKKQRNQGEKDNGQDREGGKDDTGRVVVRLEDLEEN